jgi:putative acetyltransferase
VLLLTITWPGEGDPVVEAMHPIHEQPRHQAGIRAVLLAAFGGPAEADLVAALRTAGLCEISLVIEEQERVLGHVLMSPLRAPIKALALAPLAVLPEYQRQGLGSALVRAALDQAKNAGWDAVFVLGDPAYYRRFGFDVEAARGWDCVYSGPHLQVRQLSAALPKTGRIVYPSQFAAVDG